MSFDHCGNFLPRWDLKRIIAGNTPVVYSVIVQSFHRLFCSFSFNSCNPWCHPDDTHKSFLLSTKSSHLALFPNKNQIMKSYYKKLVPWKGLFWLCQLCYSWKGVTHKLKGKWPAELPEKWIYCIYSPVMTRRCKAE